MNTYTWNCKTVDIHPQDGSYTDVVYNVHYIVDGISDDSYSGRVIGTQMVDTSTIVDFIPFDQLTNEILVGWTKDAMGEDKVSDIEHAIDIQIEQATEPTSITKTIAN